MIEDLWRMNLEWVKLKKTLERKRNRDENRLIGMYQCLKKQGANTKIFTNIESFEEMISAYDIVSIHV